MSIEQRGRMPLDYSPVAYPGSVLRFRGPAVDMSQPYILCLGGAETFGRFLHRPYPAQLAERLPLPVLNMGVLSAGLDVMMGDGAIEAAIAGATALVVQVPGAQNMTNRFYSVHPRRNDRFLKATTMLRTVYREVDFTEFHFTRHLLTHLRSLSRDRFDIVRQELQVAWTARMRRFLNEAAVPVHLLWLSNRWPDEHDRARGLGHDPLFVTRAMLSDVEPRAASLTVVAVEKAERKHPTRGMFFAAREEAAARVLPGPDAHDRAARRLARHLADDLGL